MATDVEFLISEFLREAGLSTDVFPYQVVIDHPPNWYVLVSTRPQLVVYTTGGIIKLETLGTAEPIGQWELAAPDSFDNLLAAINDSAVQAPVARKHRRLAQRTGY